MKKFLKSIKYGGYIGLIIIALAILSAICSKHCTSNYVMCAYVLLTGVVAIVVYYKNL